MFGHPFGDGDAGRFRIGRANISNAQGLAVSIHFLNSIVWLTSATLSDIKINKNKKNGDRLAPAFIVRAFK
jgi:hypothetical protein